MKALVYEGPWQFSLRELPEPRPGHLEVLVRSEAVGICGSDVHGFTGESGRRKPGMIMGHEAVGRVVDAGPGVHQVNIGDRVAVFNIVGCGKCRFCETDRVQLCPVKKILGVNAGMWGAMAEYFVFPESGLVKLDPASDPAIGLLARGHGEVQWRGAVQEGADLLEGLKTLGMQLHDHPPMIPKPAPSGSSAGGITPLLQAHLPLEIDTSSRLILYWTRLTLDEIRVMCYNNAPTYFTVLKRSNIYSKEAA